MSRRADPVRIYAAQRAGMRTRMVNAWRLSEAKAEVLLAEWEAEATRRGLSSWDQEFWMQAEAWLAERH